MDKNFVRILLVQEHGYGPLAARDAVETELVAAWPHVPATMNYDKIARAVVEMRRRNVLGKQP